MIWFSAVKCAGPGRLFGDLLCLMLALGREWVEATRRSTETVALSAGWTLKGLSCLVSCRSALALQLWRSCNDKLGYENRAGYRERSAMRARGRGCG